MNLDKIIKQIISEEKEKQKSKYILTESDLHHLIKTTTRRLLSERWENVQGQKMKERETPPTVTLKAYKQVMLTSKTKTTGLVYPLYVDSDSGWKIGQWYDAGIGDYKIEIDDHTNEPTGKVKVNSKLGGLAFRPGLHFGSVPYAPHIYTKKSNFSDEKKPDNLDSKGKLRKDYDYSKTRLQKKNVVWAECEISFDIDYNEEAKRNGDYVNKQGKTVNNPSNSCLKKLPVNGAYSFRTNSNAPRWATWYIAGAFKINRLLSDEEVKTLCAQHNVVSLEREGVLDLSSYPLLN